MEEERKRKRREGQNKKDKQAAEAEEAAPSEEEVEEFFSILRNMQLAVKYFEKNGDSILNLLKGDDDDDDDEDEITAIQSQAHDVKDTRPGLQLDLNAVPEDNA